MFSYLFFFSKLQELNSEEEKYFQRIVVRLDHLKQVVDFDLKDTKAIPQKNFQRTQTDRILVDYLLRQGCFETANALAEQSKITV